MHAETLRLFASLLPRLFVAAAVLSWGGACSWRAARARLNEAPWDVRFLASAVLFAIALTVPALALGALGLLRDWTWALAALAAFSALRLASESHEPLTLDESPAPSTVFALTLGGFALGRMLFVLRNPPADWDSYHYHLPMMAAWMQSGALGVPPHVPAPFGQFFPGSGELLETALAWATGRDTLVPWIGIAGLVLLALALRRLALLAGAKPAIAEACALLAAAGPGVTQLTLGAKVDHLLAAWFAIALVFALRYRRSVARAELALVVCACGLLPGVKTTGPVYALLALVVALFTLGVATRLRALFACRAALATALFAGAFWYVRNYAGAGNPLFPAQLVAGGHTLAGLMTREELRGTTQMVVWLERGFDQGHVTVRHVLTWYGPGIAALGFGALLWLGELLPHGDEPIERRNARLVATLAALSAVFFLFTPFSGVYRAVPAGQPLKLNFDNLRLLLPTVTLLAPLAARALSRLRGERAIVVLLALLWLAGLARKLSHVGPGVIIVVAVWALARLWRSRHAQGLSLAQRGALGVALVLLVATAVSLVDASRERTEAKAWNGFLGLIPNLRWEQLHRLRAESAGHRIAIAGPASWWGLYGRDFAGRPAYVPVASDWNPARAPWRFTPEARERADHARWLANLRASGARFVVVSGLGDDCAPIPELAWCAADTARFAVLDTANCSAAYRVRDAAPANGTPWPLERAPRAAAETP